MSKNMNRRFFLQSSGGLIASLYGIDSFAYSENIEKNRSKKIAIFGSGIAGMTAAHELVERGFQVVVYESKDDFGGKARTIFVPGTSTPQKSGLPGEHGFRMFAGFYKHTFDIMKRTPFQNNSNGVYDNLYRNRRSTVSLASGKQFHLPLYSNITTMGFDGMIRYFQDLISYNNIGISTYEIGIFFNRMAMVLASCEDRRYAEYEKISWYDFVQSPWASPLFMELFGTGLTTLVQAVRGPDASARTMALSFYNTFSHMLTNPNGGVFSLNAPTSLAWINPWHQYLESKGVKFMTGHTLTNLLISPNGQIQKAQLLNQGQPVEIQADYYISALPPEVLKKISQRSGLDQNHPAFAAVHGLRSEWMVGAQYFLDTDVRLQEDFALGSRTPWALTAVSSNTFWKKPVSEYGNGLAKGLISIDVSNWRTPGILFGKPAERCTQEEVKKEVWAQLLQYIDPATREKLNNSRILNIAIDPALIFSENKNTYSDELFLNTVDSWKNRPSAESNISNLMMAGDFARTYTDLACMESACESGKRAANAVLKAMGSYQLVEIHKPSEPIAFYGAKMMDQFRFNMGLSQLSVKL